MAMRGPLLEGERIIHRRNGKPGTVKKEMYETVCSKGKTTCIVVLFDGELVSEEIHPSRVRRAITSNDGYGD